MKIGFIGLGTMGLGMAQCLLAAGHDVVGYNRTASRGEPLKAKGGSLAATPHEAAAGADVVITMLSDDPAVEGVLLGEHGMMKAAKKGALFIDSSTVTPGLSRRCAQEAKQNGLRFLDAPVTGSRNEAANGKLVFIVGGEKSDYDAACAALRCNGASAFLLRTVRFGRDCQAVQQRDRGDAHGRDGRECDARESHGRRSKGRA